MIVLLDSGILGKICNPNSSAETIAVREWLYSLLAKGIGVVTTYLCDYEVRRSLIRKEKHHRNGYGYELHLSCELFLRQKNAIAQTPCNPI